MKRKSSRKQRRAKIGSHKNKYSCLAPENKDPYQGKKFRLLPIRGAPGDIIKSGSTYLWHGRVYMLIKDIVIPQTGKFFGYFKRVE